VSSPRPCLIDTNVFTWIRDRDPFEYVGSADLAISDAIAAELQGPLPAAHPIVLGNWALAPRMGGQIVDDTDVETGRLAMASRATSAWSSTTVLGRPSGRVTSPGWSAGGS
jgi:hypothetical protein